MTRRPGGNVGYSPLWGCAGDRVQVHCGTVFGDAFSTRRQICPQNSATIHLTTISTRSLVQPQSSEQLPHSLQQQRRMPLRTEWSLHWNLSMPVACSKCLTFLPTVQVKTGLWGWTTNKDGLYFLFHRTRACQQFQAVYVKKMFGMTP